MKPYKYYDMPMESLREFVERIDYSPCEETCRVCDALAKFTKPGGTDDE